MQKKFKSKNQNDNWEVFQILEDPRGKIRENRDKSIKKTKQNNHKQTQKNIFLFLYVNKGLYNS